MSDLTLQSGSERKITGRHVLYMILAFFGVMLIANAIFIWLAVGTFTGVVSETAYRDGLAHNQRLEAAAEQRARGWHGALTLSDGQAVLILKDRDGAPVSGMILTAAYQRPTQKDLDRSLPMTEVAAGRYQAPADLPAPGNWDLVVSGSDAAGRRFETQQRLWIE